MTTRYRQQGLSLIELMISMAIGLGLLAALTTVFVNSSRSQSELARASQQIENGRFATQTLQTDLAHAGFYGRYVASTTTAPVALPDPCSTDPVAMVGAMPFAVQGYQGGASVPAGVTCISSDDYLPDTDVLVVRRAESRTADAAALGANTFYIQSVAEAFNPITLTALQPIIAKGNPATTFNQTSPTTGALGEIRRYRVHIYFIAKCSVPAGGAATCNSGADSGKPIPTLKRLEIDSTGAFQVVPLVEGIEQMQVEYGIDTVPAGLPAGSPYAGDGMPDAYKDAPSAAEFTQAVSARLFLLARATEESVAYKDSKTYDLGMFGTVAGNDAYKRHVFTTTVRLQNVTGWREK